MTRLHTKLEAHQKLRYNGSVMRVKTFRRLRCLTAPWGAGLAIALLCTAVTFAQENNPAQSSADPPTQAAPQGQPGSTSKKNGDSADGSATTKLRIVVTDANDKPVANASVYVRYNESGGFLHHDKLAELNLKTNQDGSVKVPEIPQGRTMIQVIAKGWHTFGKWYDIDKDEESVAIKLDVAPHWY